MLALHDIERKLLLILKNTALTLEEIAERSNLHIDQVRRGVEWLRYKNLVETVEKEKRVITLGNNGLDALRNGLPEHRVVDAIKELGDGLSIKDLKAVMLDRGMLEDEFNAAIKHAKAKGLVNINNGRVYLLNDSIEDREHAILKRIAKQEIELISKDDTEAFNSLKKRPGYIIERSVKQVYVYLTERGREVINQLESGASIRTIDVSASAPVIYAGRRHILQDVIDEVREILIGMGFQEIDGSIVQYSFWNFDALFTPQDHPAREMQDTFYLDVDSNGSIASSELISRVASVHEMSWGQEWSISEAKRLVLRTHTTAVTIRYLAEHKPKEANVFSVGRVFRNEKVNYKHLAEFHQVEGIVVSDDVTLRDLMGIQQEFYKRLGLSKVRFWPTYFPYTEPSLQSMVYHERLGRWVELFGMGIFRPEVTEPIGVKSRVLAWGGGLERIAMLKYGMDDVRELYANRLSVLRGTPLWPWRGL